MRRQHINYLKSIRNAGIGFLVAFSAYWVVQLLWWEFYPYKTADIEEPMTILNENKIVEPGDKLELELTFTKYSNLAPEVSRNVICVDDSVHFVQALPSTGVARPIGTFTARNSYQLPESIPRNINCYFQFTNEYQVNPIRIVTKTWKSEVFTVVD